MESEDGALSSPKEAGGDAAADVRRWLAEIKLSDKTESDWRKTAKAAHDVYRGKKKTSFNILWANTEVIRPNLYNSTPKPDVRRRYRDADPLGKEISTVLERALSFEADACDFDSTMEAAVFGVALPGRGAVRVRFEPYYEMAEENGEEVKMLAGAKTYPEVVPWETFRRGPAARWDDVPWIAYQHALTKDQIKKQFKGFEEKVSYDIVVNGADDEQADREPSVFKRVCVWEIWDKDNRQILWIAPSYEFGPLEVEEDKLGLKGFFDMPKPMYAVDDSDTLVPVCEYALYEEQAKELDEVTARINKLTKALKVRGLYDSTIAELASLMESGDNEMIPTQDATIALQSGGLDKAIWMFPLEQIAKVLAQLYVQREQIKGTIYEIIGISDILRGQTDANETLGAQEIKAQSGSVRLQRRQRDVQRFARDVFRIMAEIISEHYPPELLSIMTGVQVTPQMIEIMRRDLLRGIHVDVETDSTIAADQARTRKDIAEVMEAVGGFVANFGPAVQSGAISMEATKKILLSIIRKARLGRDVEDAIEQDTAQPQKPDPEMMKMQAEQQNKQAEMQMKAQEAQANMQLEQAKMQMTGQNAQAELAIKQQEAQARLQLEGEKLQAEMAKIPQELQLKREQMLLEHELKREQMMLEVQLRREQIALDAQVKTTVGEMRNKKKGAE